MPQPPTISQALTEEEIDQYYSYDMGLIRAITHNFSWAGLKNQNQLQATEYSARDLSLHRSESESLTFSYDPIDRSLMLSVSDPRCEDSHYEMTVILLSQQEAHVLRSLLNKLPL